MERGFSRSASIKVRDGLVILAFLHVEEAPVAEKRGILRVEADALGEIRQSFGRGLLLGVRQTAVVDRSRRDWDRSAALWL